jgi:hypothetical protein
MTVLRVAVKEGVDHLIAYVADEDITNIAVY